MPPLQTQQVEQLMQGGLNESVDPRVLPPGSMLTVDNLVYNDAGALVKRNGIRDIGMLDDTGSSLHGVEMLRTFGDEVLAIHNGTGNASPYLVSLVDHGSFPEWRTRDDVGRFVVRRKPLVRSHHDVVFGQCATTSAGVIVHCWLDGITGYVMMRAVDEKTGAIVTADVIVSATAGTGSGIALFLNQFKLVTCSVAGMATRTPMLVVNQFSSPNCLIGYYWNPSTNQFAGPVTLATQSGGSYNQIGVTFFDVTDLGNGNVALAYQHDRLVSGVAADRHQIVQTFDTTWTPVHALLDLGPPVAGSLSGGNPQGKGITCCGNLTNLFVAWCSDDGSIYYVQLHTSTLAFVLTATRVQDSTIGGQMFDPASGLDTNGFMRLSWYGNQPASLVKCASSITAATVAAGGGLFNYYTLWNSLALCSPFINNGNTYQIFATYSGVLLGNVPNQTQGVYLARASLYILDDANNFGEVGAAVFSPFRLVADLSPDSVQILEVLFPNSVTPPAVRADKQLQFDQTCVADASFRNGIDTFLLNGELHDVAKFNVCEANGLMFMSGGLTSMYDGEGVYEAGFLPVPNPASATTAASGSATVSYIFIWEWWDAKGNLHQSALSQPVDFPDSASPLGVLPHWNGGATFKIWDLAVTLRGRQVNGDQRHVRLGVYRTTNGGTTYFRVNPPRPTSDADILPGDGSIPQLTFVDSVSDAQLVANGYGILYADPETQIFDNEGPPASLDVHTHLNRVWLVSAEDDHELWFSQEFQDGVGVRWNSGLVVRIDASTDGICALASLDGGLIAFTPTKIFAIDGDGPNQTGAQNDYRVSRIISNVGCANPKSIVEYEGGVAFQCPNGHIYLLDRSRTLSYLGQPIENTSEQFKVALSVVLDDRKTTIFWMLAKPNGTTVNGTVKCVLYDYRNNAWSTWSLPTNEGRFDGLACVDPSGLFLCSAGGNGGGIWRETVGLYIDGAAPISGPGTPFATTLALPWMRVDAIAGFQRVRRLTVTGKSQYESALTAFISYDYDDTFQQSFLRNVSDESPFQADFHLTKQKCSAIRVTFSDQSVAGAGVNFIGVTWEVGVLPGRNKWAQGNRGVPQ